MFPPGLKSATDAPKFIINPAAATESIWLPRIYQVVFGHKNKSYLNSLWLGTLWQVVEMPERLWYEGLKPTLLGRPDVTAKCMMHLPWTVLRLFIAGVLGRAMAVDITVSQRTEAMIAPPELSRKMTEDGCDKVVLCAETDFIARVRRHGDKLP